jgi:hypothetical protein
LHQRFPWLDVDALEAIIDVLREHPSIGYRMLARSTGVTPHQARTFLTWLRRSDLEVVLDQDNALSAIRARLAFDEIEEAPEAYVEYSGRDDDSDFDMVEDAFDVEQQYHYDVSKDFYLVTLRIRGKDRAQRVPGPAYRAMRQAYSDWDGDRQTLNQVAKEFGVSRAWFQALKSAMGWTHDSDPFTDEEVAEVDTDELAQRAIQRKRHALEKKYDRLSDEQDRRDAERYRKLEKLVIEPLVDDLTKRLSRLQPVPVSALQPSVRPYAAVVSPTDLHYGKHSGHGTVVDPYSRNEAERRLTKATGELLEHLSLYGRPEDLIVAMGSDWFHIDNTLLATTKGTRQDVDGYAWQVISGGVELGLAFIERLRTVADRVTVLVMPGNHDEFASLFFLKLLEVRYAGVSDVQVVSSLRPRQYLAYGETLMGFTHGHHWKRDMVSKILTEPDRELLYRTSERVWFTGHRHHEESKDYGGVRWYQMPSLSGDDRWHDQNGYNLARKSLSGYVVRRDCGVVAQLYAPPEIFSN